MEFKTDVAMCLCCSRSYVLTRQAIYAAKKRGHNYTGYFCSRACAGKWKQFEAGRKHKCAKCNRRTGWARRGDIVCLTCQHANRIGSGTCPRCNQTFEKHQREQTFCSMACYRKYKVEMRQIPCTKCGKQFSPISNRRIKFCSRDCANKGPLGENRGKKKRAIIEQLRVLRLMNRQRMKDEKAWRKEQKKICRCGQPIFEGAIAAHAQSKERLCASECSIENIKPCTTADTGRRLSTEMARCVSIVA